MILFSMNSIFVIVKILVKAVTVLELNINVQRLAKPIIQDFLKQAQQPYLLLSILIILFILNEEQAKEICNKINKIVCGEESVKDLFGYLKDLYIANKETL